MRVIAATNRNLEEMVARNQFREDLFYRLNGYTISLPPMRERGDDIDLLVDHFRRQANRDLDKSVRPIPAETMDILRKYSWPGNVREVQNVIRQAVLQTTGPVLLPAFLPEYIRVQVGDGTTQEHGTSMVDDSLSRLIDARLRAGTGQLYDEVMGQVESQLVERALNFTGGNKLEAVRLLGTNPAKFRSTAALRLLDVETSGGRRNGAADTLIQPGMTMEEIEKEAIHRALKQNGGRRTEAAQLLGLSVRTLQRKIKEYDLE